MLTSFFKFFLLSLLFNTYGLFYQSFLRKYLILDYEIFDNFVFSLKVLQPLMATAEVLVLVYVSLKSTCGVLFAVLATFSNIENTEQESFCEKVRPSVTLLTNAPPLKE